METVLRTDRYERKFFISKDNESSIDILIKIHPALFRPLYYERRVNNLYFDTIDLSNYENHVAGVTNRWKVRIRWYGKTFGKIDHPILEIKMKHGEVGMKKNFPLVPFAIGDTIDQSSLLDLMRKSSLPPYWNALLQDLRPVLLNSYVRTYWISSDDAVRLTVDREWISYPVATSSSLRIISPIKHEGAILEMKYAIRDQKKATAITTKWPWRLTRNSKYVIGLEEFLSR